MNEREGSQGFTGVFVAGPKAPNKANWRDTGRDSVSQAPTYGSAVPLSLCWMGLFDSRIEIDLTLPNRIGETPVYLKTRLPVGYSIKEVTVNGTNSQNAEHQWIVLRNMASRVRIVVIARRRSQTP